MQEITANVLRTFEPKSSGAAFIDRAFVYFCAVSFPLFSASILVLQPNWSKVFLALSVAASLLGLFVMRLRRDLYIRALILFGACAAFVIIKLLHDWTLGLPMLLDKYLSFVTRLTIAIFFAVALSDKLQLMLRALCTVSAVIVVHAILGQLLVIFLRPADAPLLDAAEANSFTYYQIAWLFFYSQTMYVTEAIHIYRAHGVIWEPGIFQFFCNYLIVYGFSQFGASKKRLLVTLGVAGIIVSTSTMGALLAATIILVNTKFSWRSIVGVGAIVVIPSIFIFANKFDIGAAQSLSTVIRLVDLEVPLNYAMQFPILGVGNDSSVVRLLGVHSYLLDYLLSAGQQQLLSEYMDTIFDTDRVFNTSNGLLALLMQYGVVFAGVYIYGFRNFARWTGLGYSFFILILFTTFNEPISLTVLFLWMAMHGLVMPRYLPNARAAHVAFGGTPSPSSMQESI
jgi:hypothetical protein